MPRRRSPAPCAGIAQRSRSIPRSSHISSSGKYSCGSWPKASRADASSRPRPTASATSRATLIAASHRAIGRCSASADMPTSISPTGHRSLLNVSSEAPGLGAGVLIRAIEPTDGIAIMERKRGTKRRRDLTRGPGRLCAALDIDRRLEGIDPLSDGSAVARLRRAGIRRDRAKPTHRHHPRDR